MHSSLRCLGRLALSTVSRRAFATEGAAAVAASSGHEMSFTFACPAAVFYHKADVAQVDVPSYSGAFGILPNHVPTLAVLKPGVVVVKEKDTSSKFFVSSGCVTVNDDSSVQILAEEACRLEDLDADACRKELADAQSAANEASDDTAKVEAQIRIEAAEALVKAIGEA